MYESDTDVFAWLKKSTGMLFNSEVCVERLPGTVVHLHTKRPRFCLKNPTYKKST